MKTWNKRVVSQTSQLSLAILACTISLSASLVQASITLPPQKVFAIDTAHHGKGVLFSFKDGEQLEGCNSPNVFVPESLALDRTLSIALSAYYANLNIQFNVQGCAEGAMQATALAIAKVYDTPGTHYTIASNLTQVNLASLVDPNSASIFYITIDHNTRLIGANGITGATGSNGANGRDGYISSSTGHRYINGVNGGSGGAAGNGGNGDAGIDLAGFSGKKVTIINNGIIQGGNGGQGGRGGHGGNGGIGTSAYGQAKNDSGTNCNWYGLGSGGAGGNNGVGGSGGSGSEAIINIEGVDFTLTGNATVNGVAGTKGANGTKGKKGADGIRLGCH